MTDTIQGWPVVTFNVLNDADLAIDGADFGLDGDGSPTRLVESASQGRAAQFGHPHVNCPDGTSVQQPEPRWNIVAPGYLTNRKPGSSPRFGRHNAR